VEAVMVRQLIRKKQEFPLIKNRKFKKVKTTNAKHNSFMTSEDYNFREDKH
jgi:hypothetical protein